MMPNAYSGPERGIIDPVTGATDEIFQAIEQADGMPHGRARIARLEQLIPAADELPERIGRTAGSAPRSGSR